MDTRPSSATFISFYYQFNCNLLHGNTNINLYKNYFFSPLYLLKCSSNDFKLSLQFLFLLSQIRYSPNISTFVPHVIEFLSSEFLILGRIIVAIINTVKYSYFLHEFNDLPLYQPEFISSFVYFSLILGVKHYSSFWVNLHIALGICKLMLN